jgi:hypothetical protein
MEFSTIKIKYSTVSDAPESLLPAELAYSEKSGNLYIGNEQGVPLIIGGADLIEKFGTLDALVQAMEDTLGTAAGNAATAIARINQLQTDVDNEDARLQGEINRVEGALNALSNEVVTPIKSQVDGFEQEQADQDELIEDHEKRLGDVESMLGVATGSPPTFDELVITGKLTINGTLTSVNTEQTVIKDPLLELGEGTTGYSDGKDRGILFKHTLNGEVKTGFFGMDDTDASFRFIPYANEVSDGVFEGETGTIVANLDGSATRLETARKIEVKGEVSGFVYFDGTEDAAINAEVKASVDPSADSVVRRDAAGAAKFAAIETSAASKMFGGIHGKAANGLPSHITGFVIDGGTF